MEQIILQTEKQDFRQPGRKNWMSLFYCLPRKLLQKHTEFLAIPRIPYVVFHTDKYDDLICSEAFEYFVRREYEKAIWRCVQVPKASGAYDNIHAPITDFSEGFAIRRLAWCASDFMRLLLDNSIHSEWILRKMPAKNQIDWMPPLDFNAMVARMTAQVIAEQNWQPIIDFAWHEITLEDFGSRMSRRKISVYRKWHHLRTHVGRTMQSYDALLEKSLEDGYSFDLPDLDSDPAVIFMQDRDDEYEYHGWGSDGPYDEWLAKLLKIERRRVRTETDIVRSAFGFHLCHEDRQMLALRIEGYTLKEIAEIQCFSSHTGVVNRLKQIEQHYFDDEPLSPRRKGLIAKEMQGWAIKPLYSLHIGRYYISKIASLRNLTYCQSCLKKENPSKVDSHCNYYRKGGICAAADLKSVHRLCCKPRKKVPRKQARASSPS